MTKVKNIPTRIIDALMIEIWRTKEKTIERIMNNNKSNKSPNKKNIK